MVESARDRDEWRRRHSLLALWQDATALELRDTSLLSIAVDDRSEDQAALHRMARFCRDAGNTGHDEVVEAAAPLRPASATEPVGDAPVSEPSDGAAHPHPDHGSAAPAFSPPAPGSDRPAGRGLTEDSAFSAWQPAHGSATHPEPSVTQRQMDEISESLREVRKELDLLRERRTRRYF